MENVQNTRRESLIIIEERYNFALQIIFLDVLYELLSAISHWLSFLLHNMMYTDDFKSEF